MRLAFGKGNGLLYVCMTSGKGRWSRWESGMEEVWMTEGKGEEGGMDDIRKEECRKCG